MRYIITALFAVICLSCTSAGAAELFVRKDQPSASSSQSIQPFVPKKKKTIDQELDIEQEKRQTQGTNSLTGKELANAYYKNCIKTPPGIMKISSLNALCGCTAAEITNVMSVNEIRTMYENTPEGEFQRQRMMALVYVPCMKFPVSDMVSNNCLGQKAIREGLKKPVKVCNCLGNTMGDYVAEHGAYHARNALKDPEAGIDVQALLNKLMESAPFQDKSKQTIERCMQKHELGWD